MLDEFLLDRMQRAVFAGDAFDRRNVGIGGAFHQNETGADSFAILNNHATAAVTGRAAVFDAGEAELIAEDIHEFCIRRC